MAALEAGNAIPAYALAQHGPFGRQVYAVGRGVEVWGGKGRRTPHQRNGRTVLARLVRAASQDQSNKRKVFHNPAASSWFLSLARGF